MKPVFQGLLGILLMYFVLACLLALWEVGWKLAALPGWVYLYALLTSVLGVLGYSLVRLDHPARPDWQRVLLRGFGLVLPLMGLLLVRKAAAGEWQDQRLLPLYLGVWSVLALVSGTLTVTLDKRAAQGNRTARVLKDWF